jgi:hypothetical protein
LYEENKDSDLFIFNWNFIIFLTLFASSLNGIGSGLIWVAVGKYISECATD